VFLDDASGVVIDIFPGLIKPRRGL